MINTAVMFIVSVIIVTLIYVYLVPWGVRL